MNGKLSKKLRRAAKQIAVQKVESTLTETGKGTTVAWRTGSEKHIYKKTKELIKNGKLK